MASAAQGPRAFKPEVLHADLTEIFLRAEGAELESLPAHFPQPPVVELGNGIIASNVGHSFINNYFSPEGGDAGNSDPAGSAPNTYETRRQKRIGFLAAGQSFFELRVPNDKLQIYLLGNPRFHGPGSLALRFAEETPDSPQAPDSVIFTPMMNENSELPPQEKINQDAARIARQARQLLY